jgi:hypothetical protein
MQINSIEKDKTNPEYTLSDHVEVQLVLRVRAALNHCFMFNNNFTIVILN